MSRIDAETARELIASYLPIRARWQPGRCPLDLDFTIGRNGLRRPAPDLFSDAVTKADLEDWETLQIFGEYDYAEGGGAHVLIGLHDSDDAVYTLDVELDDPVTLMSESLPTFIEMFLLVDNTLAKGEAPIQDILPSAQSIDPVGYAAFWLPLIQSLTNDE